MAAPQKQYPKDALVIIAMMKELGITEYEPRVVTQLLEFATRYVSCVLDDARAFANHSKKKSIDIEDVKLSVMMQLDKVFCSPPPRDLLLEVARLKNNVPLPVVKPHCGIRLPPDRYCFSSANYKLKSNSSKKSSGGGKCFSFGGGGLHNSLGSGIKLNKQTQPIPIIKQQPQTTSTPLTRTTPSMVGGLNATGVPSPASLGTNPPVIKFTTTAASHKIGQPKPKIHVMGSPVTAPTPMEVSTVIKSEPDESPPTKRKREDDEMEEGGGVGGTTLPRH